MDNCCRFCTILRKTVSNESVQSRDKFLFQSKNFVVFPTVGALIEGWLLIVPKDHVLCMGALRQELHSELDELRGYVSLALEDLYGPVTVFEHGPAQPGHLVGCGVDHAHLHILPTQLNLIEKVKEIFPEPLEWEYVRDIRETARLYREGAPYLYVEQSPGMGYVTSHPALQSQMFRRVIARDIGRPEEFNWSQFPQEANILSTVEKLEQWLLRNDCADSDHSEIRRDAARPHQASSLSREPQLSF
jgi:diadenosine tetraphosphate (Ap4A) HIT family hydrolase